MHLHETTRRPSCPGHRLFALVMIAVLLVPLLAAVPVPGSTQKAQPLLLQTAAAQPDGTVRVIVQKAQGATGVDMAIARLGGTVIHDLSIINALAAELPGRAVPALARAQGVERLSLDAPVRDTSYQRVDGQNAYDTGYKDSDELPFTTENAINYYTRAIGADNLWNKDGAPYLQGQGVTVAVVDSGVNDHPDLRKGWDRLAQMESRVIIRKKFNENSKDAGDAYGHGTHIGGIIGGNAYKSTGQYMGVAPKVNLISVKVSDDKGAGMTSDVVAGLQWIYENHEQFNIRVVNVSLNSGVAEPYHESVLNAALEILWFNGIVVVVSGGNNGSTDNGILYPPANDPFFISVGATDANGDITYYSAYGTTESGFSKPDLVAPGHHIVSTLASSKAVLAKEHPDKIDKNDDYFSISGTSMAAAVTSGAAALLLQAEPLLTPDQVKYRLMATARPMDQAGAGAGLLDIYSAVHTPTIMSANTGIEASQLLWTGDDTILWDSVNWNSLNWNSVNWNSVNWNSVNWNSVNWNSVNWD